MRNHFRVCSLRKHLQRINIDVSGMPTIGEEIVLGEGAFASENTNILSKLYNFLTRPTKTNCISIDLKPNWDNLFRCLMQTGELYFELVR